MTRGECVGQDLRTFPPPGDSWNGIDAWLCAIAQTGTDIIPCLEHWAAEIAAGILPATRNLADFADHSWKKVLQGGLGNAWWPYFPESSQRVVEWLCLPERGASVEQAFFAQPPGPVADELSDGVRNLEAMRDYALW